ncbi:asparagine synthase-related protein [Saliphagus sp. LR7]|uniref:asparagine synthase-related protein n=1 Tax=Saliphagus sp. LR7 TaxID=2282654 RepID=UPI001E5F08CF|nr:asparagine synthase-related protein [Saliphagus sp. LR7]
MSGAKSSRPDGEGGELMVGLCWAYGHDRPPVAPVVDGLGSGARVSVREPFASVAGRVRRREDDPAAVPGGDTTLHVVGPVYSRERGDGYERRPPGTSTGEFCAEQYAADGLDGLAGLNGEFVCLVVDRERRRLHVVTDRLGSRPVYCYRGEGWLLCATAIQPLARHPAVETAFEPAPLAEYLATGTVRGIRTPLEGVERLPPASVTTIGPEGVESRRYWEPTYRPVDRPIGAFVDRFVERFRAALADRLRPGRDHGLLLSGGSDSRLLAALGGVERAYGFDDGSREVAVASRVAARAGLRFARLPAGSDRYRTLLSDIAPHANFVGWFNEGRTLGVADRLREEVDALVSGLYADVLFKGWATPTHRPFPGLSIPVPIERRIESREAYLDWQTPRSVPFAEPVLSRTLAGEVVPTGEGVEDHGVAYPSASALARFGFWFPLTNETSFDRYADEQVLPTVYPFLDRRLVDLSLELPRSHGLRYDVVGRALSRLAPDLAAIPHDRTGIAVSRPRWLHRLGAVGSALRSPGEGNAARLRGQEWVGPYLRANEATIRALPGIDYGRVLETHREHAAGGAHTGALCGLLTLLEMPMTRTVAGTGPDTETTPKGV